MLGIRIKAFFLLLSFLGVQLISIACNFINLAHEVSHAETTHEKHHHDHTHHPSETEKSDTNTEEDNCCIENSSIFLSGIEAIPASIPFIAPLSSIQFSLFLKSEIQSVPSLKSITIEIRPPPLLKISSSLLRLVIQSLQV
jgi:hypothetical protein